MVPHNVEMTAKWKALPFTLLGLNSDQGSRDDLAKRFAVSKIEYPNILLGKTSAAIPTEWGVRGWPTLVVIDKDGVIRYRGHSGPAAEAAAAALLGVASESKPTRHGK